MHRNTHLQSLRAHRIPSTPDRLPLNPAPSPSHTRPSRQCRHRQRMERHTSLLCRHQHLRCPCPHRWRFLCRRPPTPPKGAPRQPPRRRNPRDLVRESVLKTPRATTRPASVTGQPIRRMFQQGGAGAMLTTTGFGTRPRSWWQLLGGGWPPRSRRFGVESTRNKTRLRTPSLLLSSKSSSRRASKVTG